MQPTKMYRLELKELSFQENMPPLRYKDLIILLLQSPKPNCGFKKKELKLRMEMQRYVHQAEGELILGEKQLAFIQDMANNYLWYSATSQLEQFLDDLEQCEEYHEPVAEMPAKMLDKEESLVTT